MAIWTQSGCANLHINICLQAGLSSGEGASGAGNGEWGGREQVGQGGGGPVGGLWPALTRRGLQWKNWDAPRFRKFSP